MTKSQTLLVDHPVIEHFGAVCIIVMIFIGVSSYGIIANTIYGQSTPITIYMSIYVTLYDVYMVVTLVCVRYFVETYLHVVIFLVFPIVLVLVLNFGVWVEMCVLGEQAADGMAFMIVWQVFFGLLVCWMMIVGLGEMNKRSRPGSTYCVMMTWFCVFVAIWMYCSLLYLGDLISASSSRPVPMLTFVCIVMYDLYMVLSLIWLIFSRYLTILSAVFVGFVSVHFLVASCFVLLYMVGMNGEYFGDIMFWKCFVCWQIVYELTVFAFSAHYVEIVELSDKQDDVEDVV